MATNTRGPLRATSTSTVEKTEKTFRWKPADSSWHPEVKGLYNSLKKLSHFNELEESDMWQARLASKLLSDALFNSVDVNAAHIKNLFDQFDKLGITLANRRRLAIEAEKAEVANNTAQIMADYAARIVKGL